MTSEIWAALIVAASAVLVAWMQTRTHKVAKETRDAAAKTVTQTVGTSNGFARRTTAQLKDLQEHLERQDRRRDRAEQWTAQQIVSFDDRLLRIEETICPPDTDSPDQPPTGKPLPGDSRQPPRRLPRKPSTE